MRTRKLVVSLLIGVVVLALVPAFAEKFYVQLVTKIMILSIFALSLDLLAGYAGLVSLGHAAYFGVAAYTLALIAPAGDPASFWSTLPVSLAGSALAALVIGTFVVRTSGVYFIMVTLAFAQMIYYFFHDTRIAGGSDGMYIDARPATGIAGLDLADYTHFYYLVLVLLAGVFMLLSIILRSPFGRALQGIKSNEQRMRALGFATQRYKLAAFVLAGTLAGLAGYLDATLYGFVNPAQFSWRQSGVLLMTVLLGGKGTLYGPVLGALLLTFVEHYGEQFTSHYNALIGALIIAVVLFLPGGLAGLLRSARD